LSELFSFETAMPRGEFARTGLYNEWFKPQGMDKALGANLLVEGALSVAVTVYRPSSGADFLHYDVARFRALLPHLQRAMRLRNILNAAVPLTDDIDAVLAAIEKPAILVDRDALFLYANALGAAIFRNRGLILAGRGRLAARGAKETNDLHKRVYLAATSRLGEAGDKMVVHREDGTTLVLLVCPLPGARYGVKDQIAIIFVDDPERRASKPASVALLRDQYGLTRGEATLVVSLLSGATLQASASRQNIAVRRPGPTSRTCFKKRTPTVSRNLCSCWGERGTTVKSRGRRCQSNDRSSVCDILAPTQAAIRQ
jgi:hypothetical protein